MSDITDIEVRLSRVESLVGALCARLPAKLVLVTDHMTPRERVITYVRSCSPVKYNAVYMKFRGYAGFSRIITDLIIEGKIDMSVMPPVPGKRGRPHRVLVWTENRTDNSSS